MIRIFYFFCVSLSIVSVAQASSFLEDFEAPEYVPGYLENTERLVVEIVDTDSVAPSPLAQGQQSLRMTGVDDFAFVPEVTGGASVQWVDFYVKPVFVDGPEPLIALGSEQSAVVGFVNVAGEGQVLAVDGGGDLSGDWEPAGVSVPLTSGVAQKWLRLSFRIDYSTKRWDLYVDNQLVLIDLGFLDDAAAQFQDVVVSADETKATGLDYFYVGSTMQVDTDGDGDVDVDSDNDGIIDSYESENGLNALANDRDVDADNDGLSNIEEYFGGLMAGTADSDGDGLHDRLELRLGDGYDPLVNEGHSLSQIAFIETFDSWALGSLDGVNLWSVESGTATVQTSEVAAGSTQAVELLAASGEVPAVLSNTFDGSDETEIWVDFQIKPVFWGSGDGPDVADFLYAPLGVFYFNQDNTVTYLNGDGQGSGTWESTSVKLAADQWQRVTLHNDYEAQTWSLWINSVRVAQDIGFAHPQPYFNHLAFQQGDEASAYLDDLTAANSEPAALDNDGDTLPNTFERANSGYGFDPDSAADADLDVDGDGLGTAAELALGTLFDDSDFDDDGLLDGSEVILGERLLLADTYNALIDDGNGNFSWSTSFESNEGYSLAPLSGQGQWNSNLPEVSIVSAATQDGAQALALSSAAAAEAVYAQQILVTPETEKTIWVSFQAQLNAGALPEVTERESLGAFIMTRNPDGNLAVLDGSNLSWIDTGLALTDATWVRFDCRLDYTTKTWSLYADFVPIMEAIGFVNPALPVLSAIQFEQDVDDGEVKVAYIDALKISSLIPSDLSWASVSDEWKLLIVSADTSDSISNVSQVLPEDDFDGDGTDNATEYAQGRLATVADSDVDLYVTTTGADTYTGRSAVAGKPNANDGPKQTIAAALTETTDDGDIILLESGTYDESTLSLNGKNRTLRLNGPVTIH